MKRTIRANLDASAADVYEILSDLGTYAQWLDLVDRAEPAPAADADLGPAWLVTLRAKVGPFRRSKLLRMVRTEATEPSHLRFERAEIDGRTHSPWRLEVAINGDQPCAVTVELSYDGGLWSGPLEMVLRSQVQAAIPKLKAQL